MILPRSRGHPARGNNVSDVPAVAITSITCGRQTVTGIVLEVTGTASAVVGDYLALSVSPGMSATFTCGGWEQNSGAGALCTRRQNHPASTQWTLTVEGFKCAGHP